MLEFDQQIAVLFGSAVLVPILLFLLSRKTSYRSAVDDLKPDHPQYVSDEEFLAASGNVNPVVALRVRAIVSTQLGIAEHSIHPKDNFVRDLGCE